MNVLIVEDNEQMCRAIRSLIGDIADNVYECGDGRDAVQACFESRPDWVLVDLKVGEMDGLTIVRQIKLAFPEARVLVMTSYQDEEIRLEAQQAGANEFVCKEELIDVRKILTASLE